MAQNLNSIYLDNIKKQRLTLRELQSKFNEVCDKLTQQAEEKIKQLSPNDKEGKQKFLLGLKNSINEALAKFKEETHKNQTEFRKILEQVNDQREFRVLNHLDVLMQTRPKKKSNLLSICIIIFLIGLIAYFGLQIANLWK